MSWKGLEALAEQHGAILPAEGVSMEQHLTSLSTDQLEVFSKFLKSIPTISSPVEDALRTQIQLDFAGATTEEDVQKKLFEGARTAEEVLAEFQ